MIGGSCINVACIPTKTLIASARAARSLRHAAEFGLWTGEVTVDWPEVRGRAERVVGAMREMNRNNLNAPPALDLIIGAGRFVGPKTVEVRDENGKVRFLKAERIFINTGTRPAKPSIPGAESMNVHDSETIQRVPKLPRHLVVVGGSYVGLEFAQMFRGFGSQVTVLQRGPQLLKREDEDVAKALEDCLRNEGVDIRLNSSVEKLQQDPTGPALQFSTQGKPERVSASHVLLAAGRAPNTENLNLVAAGVETDARGYIKANERLETSAPGIWALGDVNGGPQFTHVSFDDYRIVKTNVFGGGSRSTSDRLVPFTLFTDPELSRVGMTEKEARQKGLDIFVAKLPVASIPRAKTMSETRGLIKVVIDVKTDQILGCSILSIEAGEMLGTVQMAMLGGLPFTALRDAVFSHPTLVEGFNNLPVNPN
jgi:pyruvate/2-oxoglutarate dehydrogenase complex dihydrolipoamide dehydrogenase (E3) component